MKRDDLIIWTVLILGFIAATAIVVGMRWAVLGHVPCSFFTVQEAPVRCLREQ